MISPFPASLHLKLCPCSAPVFVDHILSLDVSDGLPVCSSSFVACCNSSWKSWVPQRALSPVRKRLCFLVCMQMPKFSAVEKSLFCLTFLGFKWKKNPKPQQQKPNLGTSFSNASIHMFFITVRQLKLMHFCLLLFIPSSAPYICCACFHIGLKVFWFVFSLEIHHSHKLWHWFVFFSK